MTRFLALGVFLLAMAGPVAHATPVALSDEELGGIRGGIQTPLGIDIGFGANMRTFIDGQLVLETQLTWTDQGAVTQNISGTGTVGPLPGQFVLTLPSPTGGATQVQQTLSDTLIASVILNTASGRTIRQDTDITLILPQLASLQQQMGAARTAAALQSAVSAALRGSGP